MNTYNENLRSTVVASLQNQELEQKQAGAEKNASMFTLYYAEGATITATDNLDKALDVQKTKSIVKEQAVDNSNICNNLQESASQANQYVKQSISNAAVCASNIQVAANAIVRLAGDIGSIYSIVNAADFKDEIFGQTQEAHKLINHTAYAAEEASKLAMKSSIMTSEVSSSTVLDKAKSASVVMNNLLKVASDDFDAATQIVAGNNAVRAAASAKEKLAEGDFKDLGVDFFSAMSAFQMTNEKLNLNLLAYPKREFESSEFFVKFDLIKIPFTDVPDEAPPKKLKEPFYPVEKYSLIVVKNTQKTTFSIGNAEAIILGADSNNQVIPVRLGVPATSETWVKGSRENGVDVVNGVTTQWNDSKVVVDIDLLKFKLLDSDGDAIKLGTQYVVFVFASYWEYYKKKLNTFDDFLSAPSPLFKLTNHLEAVESSTIEITKFSGEIADTKTSDTVKPKCPGIPQSPITNMVLGDKYAYIMKFQVSEISDNNVEYRCMFLPVAEKQTKGMLNDASYEAFMREVKELEIISDKYDPDIARLQNELIQAEQAAILAESRIQEEKNRPKGTAKKYSVSELKVFHEEVYSYNSIQTDLQSLIHDRDVAIEHIRTSSVSHIDFIFNLILAEQVSPGNYLAVNIPDPNLTNKPGVLMCYTLYAGFGPEATDIFGNRLMNQKQYIPVVLSVSTAEEENLSAFTNALSNYKAFPPLPFFKYDEKAKEMIYHEIKQTISKK